MLKDWCYEAVSEELQVSKNMTDRRGFRATGGTFCNFSGRVFTQTVDQGLMNWTFFVLSSDIQPAGPPHPAGQRTRAAFPVQNP